MSARRLDRRQFLIATGATGLAVAAGCSSSDGQGPASTTTRVTVGPTDPAVAAAEAARPTTGTVVRRELRAAPATLDLGRQRVETWAPDIAALTMSGSSVIVALNAVLLKRLHLPRPAGHDEHQPSQTPGRDPATRATHR